MDYGFIILGVLSVIVVTSWIVLGSKFAEEDQVAPAQRVKAKVATPKATIPADAELKKMTKAKIEEVGRGLGIELDKRKTKANMIADLKAK